MKTAMNFLLTGLFCLVFSPTLTAQPANPTENWNRSLALSVVHEADTMALLKPLVQMTRSGNDSELLEALSSIERDSAMPGPLKDFVIFTYATGLGDLDANTVNPAVLQFLATYEVKTMVSHIDHPRMDVPLFNVRAATAGVQNRWDRQQASMLAEGLLQAQPEQWISAYLTASPVERMGFVDAIDFAPTEQLNQLGWSAMARLEEQPELTVVAARAGMASGDLELLQQAISRGDGPGLSRALADVSLELSDDEAADLLNAVLRSGSASRSALAISQLAPGRLDHSVMAAMLFDTLDDRNFGAAAALVLGASQDPKIQARLKEIASGKDGLSQQRARLAISTRHADRGVEK